MAQTMSRLPESLTAQSWNPALRPEDELDASVAKSISVPIMEPPSQNEETAVEVITTEETLTDSKVIPTDEPNYSAASIDGHPDPHAPSTVMTDILPEASKPHEINWGQETDSAWELQSKDWFSREDVAARTNSFPPMEKIPESSIDEPFADQQPEALEALKTHRDLQTEQQVDEYLVSDSNLDQSNNNFWEAGVTEDDEGEFFDQLKTQTKPIYVPPEAESRYEEGVPLVENESYSQPDITDQNEPHLDNVFGDDDGDAFFASTAAADASDSAIPTITRKSTQDVLGMLNNGISDSPVESSSAAPGKIDEEDLAARWEAELDEDDDLLLEDDLLHQTQGQAQELGEPDLPKGVSGADPYSQHGVPQPAPTSTYANPYAPHQPSSSELFQGLPNVYAPTSVPSASPFGVVQSRQEDAKAQSFVDQAREGYKSPYDLPESIGRSRRPAAPRKTVPSPSTAMPPPPPRTSSFPTPIPTATPSQTDVLRPASSGTSVPKNFFEELPAPAPKPRPASRTSGYVPSSVVASNASVSNVPSSMPPPLPPAQPVTGNVYQDQLQAPERVGPYANLAVPPPSSGPSAGAGVGPRYSPKPPGASTTAKSPVYSRYSPAPPSSNAPPSVRPRYVSQPSNLPFQPRTSSPLAHHEKTVYEVQQPQQRPSTSGGPPSLANPLTNHIRGSFSVPSTQVAAEPGTQTLSGSQPLMSSFNAQKNPYAPGFTSEPSRRSSTESPYLPSTGAAPPNIASPPNDIRFAPPRRSQTQSPGKQFFGATPVRNIIEPVQRPASVHAPSSPTKTPNPYTIPSMASVTREVPELAFIPPTDGRELDPLQRWKGAPVFKFGFGGLVSSCFPQHIPRYTAGQMNPMVQPAPGEAKVRQLKHVLPFDGDIVQYPGPLKTKSKKKDVIAWLSSRIAALENEGVPTSIQLQLDGHKRHDEKILLWKLLRVLVENDGLLEGKEDVQKSLRSIISPELDSVNQNHTFDSRTSSGLYQPSDVGSLSPEAISSSILGVIKNDLLVGDREKAVWRAVDNRLWGHAMIMSSALDKALWKQVVQEFVRREVRSTGENIESLSALYAIVSGNIEESIDELVPPCARLGLQMISKEGQGISKNGVDGLDRWRETLGLILNNRTPEDHQALSAMGQLLSSYGRIEASHVCYLFARAFSQRPIFGGADDPQSSVVLLGTDHLKFPTTFFRDEDAIILTEVYEFATTVLAGNTAAALPYFQPFKLQHAYILAEKGSRSEALQYCEAIGNVLKASTKPSPYFHQRLFAEIDELATCLKQAPSDGTSSWMSKPSMEKVSGSMWARFSNFVAGDESDAASNGSNADADVGPFSKVTEAATISRPPSVSELYGSYPAAQPASNAFSRYAPANQFAPSSSPEQYRGRSSVEAQRSPSIGVNYNQRRGSQEPATPADSSSPYNFASVNNYGSPTSYPLHSTPPQSSYVPLAPVEEDLPAQPQPSFPPSPQKSALTSGLQASPERFGQPIEELKGGMAEAEVPHYGGYEPPSMSAYQPPSYEPDFVAATDGPAQDEDENDEHESKPKKKSFMDDDDEDDLAARAAAIQKAEKAKRDRDADDAFRKAAEADANKPAAAKKGWFGGWWGGKKEGESSGGPIRAKLGEDNSFYYDPELKKWINKKDPNSATASARATPPPPKGPMPQSRSVSASSIASGPPVLQRPPSISQLGTAPDSRPSTGAGASPLGTSPALGVTSSPALNGPPNGLPRAVSATVVGTAPPGPSSGSTMQPPRPATASLSNANSIDDLLGAPQARKGGTVKSKKKGRGYVDVMAK